MEMYKPVNCSWRDIKPDLNKTPLNRQHLQECLGLSYMLYKLSCTMLTDAVDYNRKKTFRLFSPFVKTNNNHVYSNTITCNQLKSVGQGIVARQQKCASCVFVKVFLVIIPHHMFYI